MPDTQNTNTNKSRKRSQHKVTNSMILKYTWNSMKYTLHIPIKTCRETPSTGPKCHQIVWSPGLCPGPHWGSLQRSPRPSSWWGGGKTPSPRTPPPRPFGPKGFGPSGLAFTLPQYPQAQHPYLKIPSYGPEYRCTVSDCTCAAYCGFHLPCRHMFIVRHHRHVTEVDLSTVSPVSTVVIVPNEYWTATKQPTCG